PPCRRELASVVCTTRTTAGQRGESTPIILKPQIARTPPRIESFELLGLRANGRNKWWRLVSEEFSSANGAPEVLLVHVEAVDKQELEPLRIGCACLVSVVGVCYFRRSVESAWRIQQEN